jgi:hypothetical protein
LYKLKPLSHTGLLLIAVFLIALVLRVEVATHFPSMEWGDEIFNTLEPAHHLAYGYGVVVWEWRLGIRSWVFPSFLAGVMRLTDWMGPGSFGYLGAIRFVLSLLSLTTVWFGYAWSKRANGQAAAVIAAGACATLYELVYFAPKAFTEVVAGNLLLPGLYLGVYGEALPEKKRLFLAGLFCGLAVSLRNQLAPAVLFAVLYFCHTNWRRRSIPTFLGLLLPIVAFGLVDAITWGYPFQSFFRYLWVVVVQGRGLIYGSEPLVLVFMGAPSSFFPAVPTSFGGSSSKPFPRLDSIHYNRLPFGPGAQRISLHLSRDADCGHACRHRFCRACGGLPSMGEANSIHRNNRGHGPGLLHLHFRHPCLVLTPLDQAFWRPDCVRSS